MTTLSATKARSNLTGWLKRAANGEEIGILYGDKVIALRPVEVQASDYAQREYGVTSKQFDAFVKKMQAERKRDERSGRVKEYKGDIEALLKD